MRSAFFRVCVCAVPKFPNVFFIAFRWPTISGRIDSLLKLHKNASDGRLQTISENAPKKEYGACLRCTGCQWIFNICDFSLIHLVWPAPSFVQLVFASKLRCAAAFFVRRYPIFFFNSFWIIHCENAERFSDDRSSCNHKRVQTTGRAGWRSSAVHTIIYDVMCPHLYK